MQTLFSFLILGFIISSCNHNDGMCHRSSYVISKSNETEIEAMPTELPAD